MINNYAVVLNLGNDRKRALRILQALTIPAYTQDWIENGEVEEIKEALKIVMPRAGDISEKIGDEGCLLQEVYETTWLPQIEFYHNSDEE